MGMLSEKDILFDDVTALEMVLGKGALSVSSVNANCDCVSYTSTGDDNEFHTQISAGPIAEAR